MLVTILCLGNNTGDSEKQRYSVLIFVNIVLLMVRLRLWDVRLLLGFTEVRLLLVIIRINRFGFLSLLALGTRLLL